MAKKTKPNGAAARLKDEIDRGLTHEKTGHPDPAAAPLGTDAEAAGQPAAPDEVEASRSREVDPAGREPAPGEHGESKAPGGFIITLAIGLSLALVGILAVFVLR